MLVLIFIKCRFNFKLFALVNKILLQAHPYQRRKGKGYFKFLLNKCLTPRINERSNKDKILFANIFLGKISKDNSTECKITFHS